MSLRLVFTDRGSCVYGWIDADIYVQAVCSSVNMLVCVLDLSAKFSLNSG